MQCLEAADGDVDGDLYLLWEVASYTEEETISVQLIPVFSEQPFEQLQFHFGVI